MSNDASRVTAERLSDDELANVLGYVEQDCGLDIRQHIERHIAALRASYESVVALLREARPAVFAQHMHDIGTRVAPESALFKRIDRAIYSARAANKEPIT